MNHAFRLFAVTTLALFAGCELLHPPQGSTTEPAPAPGGETAPAHPYAHMPQRQSFKTMANVELKAGCYNGDFVCGRSQLRVKGAGVDQTVIHGNLVLQTQCEVSGVTVTGDVIFEGHQAKLLDSDFYGQVVDHGMQNRY
jgi:hypothetical protein